MTTGRTAPERRYVDQRVFGDTRAGGKAHIVTVLGTSYCGRPIVSEYPRAVPLDMVCLSCLRARLAVEAIR